MVKDTTTTSPELNTTDFPQVIPMTFEEKVRMYMKCSVKISSREFQKEKYIQWLIK